MSFFDADDDGSRGRNPYLVGIAKCIRETDKAIGVKIKGKPPGSIVWIPKSVVHDDSEVYGNGHEGKLIVQRWFAEKEEL